MTVPSNETRKILASEHAITSLTLTCKMSTYVDLSVINGSKILPYFLTNTMLTIFFIDIHKFIFI